MARVYIGLGSNLGDRLAYLRRAVGELGRLGSIVGVSSVYETPPWGDADQPKYLNACCALRTDLSPMALFANLKDIERRLGRRPSRRWGPREIDLDILLYDDLVLHTRDLTIPHPRIAERAFVLTPLAELDPDVRLPGQTEPVRALASRQEEVCARWAGPAMMFAVEGGDATK